MIHLHVHVIHLDGHVIHLHVHVIHLDGHVKHVLKNELIIMTNGSLNVYFMK